MTFSIESTFDSTPADQSSDMVCPKVEKTADDYLSMLADQDQLLKSMEPPANGSINFEIDGVPFSGTHKPVNDNESQIIIWGTLGYLPYSVDDYENRKYLIKILNETCRLHKVKFGVDKEMKLIAMGKFTMKTPLPSDYFFVPIVTFMQEARPYIRLIGEYL